MRIQSPWVCIIDSGDGAKGHTSNIAHTMDHYGIKTINLAILSHFDKDHIGGFKQLIENNTFKLLEYWSPYTPAFIKYEWLFGSRAQTALKNAKELEELLVSKKVRMISPLEGYVSPVAPDFKITVFSPPAKIYERLLSGKNVKEFFENYRTPVKSLIGDNTDYMSEGLYNELIAGINNRRKGQMIIRDLHKETMELSTIRKDTFPIDSTAVSNIEPDFLGIISLMTQV